MKNTRMKVIGFDPSLTHWGWVKAEVDTDTGEYTVIDMGIIETDNRDTKKNVRVESDNLKRAREVHTEVVRLCEGQKLAFSEIPLFGSWMAGTQSIARSGMVIGLLAACPTPVIQVFPRESKKLAVGSPNADKSEMIDWAYRKFPDAPWRYRTLKGKQILKKDNEHLADAIAAVNAGLQTEQFRQVLAMYKSMLE